VSANGRDQVRRSAVVEEEYSLSQAPQWRGPELTRPRFSLTDSVAQADTHVVKKEV
jgi:hypothetical protein